MDGNSNLRLFLLPPPEGAHTEGSVSSNPIRTDLWHQHAELWDIRALRPHRVQASSSGRAGVDAQGSPVDGNTSNATTSDWAVSSALETGDDPSVLDHLHCAGRSCQLQPEVDESESLWCMSCAGCESGCVPELRVQEAAHRLLHAK